MGLALPTLIDRIDRLGGRHAACHRGRLQSAGLRICLKPETRFSKCYPKWQDLNKKLRTGRLIATPEGFDALWIFNPDSMTACIENVFPSEQTVYLLAIVCDAHAQLACVGPTNQSITKDSVLQLANKQLVNLQTPRAQTLLDMFNA